jgi:GNAT superfamily N-acetyltransferase
MALERAHPVSAYDRAEARRRLIAIFADAAAGRFPPSDGTTRVLAQPSDRDAGVLSFTGCSVIFADTDPDWVAARLAADDLSEPLSARFLSALGHRLGRRSHSVDMLACANACSRPPPASLELRELTLSDGAGVHPRVARALHYRDDVRAWQTQNGSGVLIIGRGVARRWETAIEVDPVYRGRGLGTRLARAARHLVPADAALWAQIAPANAASVRAFLAAGFRPVGAEALLSPVRSS